MTLLREVYMHGIQSLFEKSYRLGFVKVVSMYNVNGDWRSCACLVTTSVGWCDGICVKPSGRVEGKSFLGTFENTCLYESTSFASNRVLPI